MSKQALLLIDLQRDYFPGGRWQLDGVDAAAANAARLLAAARRAGDLVVHIRHENARADAPFFVRGSAGAQIHPSVLNGGAEPVIVKHYPSSFRETELAALLERHGIQDLVIAGAMSHMCVDAGVRAAVDLGYGCTVAHDACATRALEFDGVQVTAPQVHAAFMAALRFGYAKVASTTEILAEILTACGDAGGAL